jgi:hypothetical protein
MALPATAVAKDAAEALIDEFNITTYDVSRLDDDVYEVQGQNLIVVTLYCYVYATYETAVITDDRIIFIDSNDECDVKGVYRR